jgi:hypothetical protein
VVGRTALGAETRNGRLLKLEQPLMDGRRLDTNRASAGRDAGMAQFSSGDRTVDERQRDLRQPRRFAGRQPRSHCFFLFGKRLPQEGAIAETDIVYHKYVKVYKLSN